jgi:YidC/Oxa1 family membrane protein insertase
MSQKKSKFDPGTIIGVTLAILLFFGLQYYMTSQQAEKQKAYQIAYDKWKKDQDALAAANAANAALSNPNGTAPNGATPELKAGAPAENPNAKPPDGAIPEPTRAADIKVTSDLYDITFTADGGALRSATFNQEWINPLKKDAKGLEFLAEIESGKLTYGITRFEVGTGGDRTVFEGLVGPQRALSRRVGKLESDSGSFDDKGVRTVVYSVALTGGHTLKRTYTVHKTLEHVDTDLTLTNGSDKPVTFSYVMYGPTGVLLDGPKENPKTGAAVFALKSPAAPRSPPVANPKSKCSTPTRPASPNRSGPSARMKISGPA